MENQTKTKLLVNTALIYAILGMIGGVFYREFTKFNNFTGNTSLAFVHLHLFAMGTLWFLIVVLLNLQFKLYAHKKFMFFYKFYNFGLWITIITFIWRGITQVLPLELTKASDSMISGIVGIGHICLGVGIITFFIILKSELNNL